MMAAPMVNACSQGNYRKILNKYHFIALEVSTNVHSYPLFSWCHSVSPYWCDDILQNRFRNNPDSFRNNLRRCPTHVFSTRRPRLNFDLWEFRHYREIDSLFARISTLFVEIFWHIILEYFFKKLTIFLWKNVWIFQNNVFRKCFEFWREFNAIRGSL